MTTTLEQLRADIEAGKRAAKAHIDGNMGAGSYDRIDTYSRSETSKRALHDICDAIKRA